MKHFDASKGDAMEYAEEFMRIFGNRKETIDTATMFGWFANAMCWARSSVEMENYRKAQAYARPIGVLLREKNRPDLEWTFFKIPLDEPINTFYVDEKNVYERP